MDSSHNPCNFQPWNGCIAYRNGDLWVTKNGCCINGCSALGDNWCTSKNLACKSFLCETAYGNLDRNTQALYTKIIAEVRTVYWGHKWYWAWMGENI